MLCTTGDPAFVTAGFLSLLFFAEPTGGKWIGGNKQVFVTQPTPRSDIQTKTDVKNDYYSYKRLHTVETFTIEPSAFGTEL